MNRNSKLNTVAATSVTPQLIFVAGWLLAAMVALTIAAQVN